MKAVGLTAAEAHSVLERIQQSDGETPRPAEAASDEAPRRPLFVIRIVTTETESNHFMAEADSFVE